MDKTFRALADPTRRQILRLLKDGPRGSGEIAEAFPSSWATVSRHLAVLREAGLVVAERDGQMILYELNTSVFRNCFSIWRTGPGRRSDGSRGRPRRCLAHEKFSNPWCRRSSVVGSSR